MTKRQSPSFTQNDNSFSRKGVKKTKELLLFNNATVTDHI